MACCARTLPTGYHVVVRLAPRAQRTAFRPYHARPELGVPNCLLAGALSARSKVFANLRMFAGAAGCQVSRSTRCLLAES